MVAGADEILTPVVILGFVSHRTSQEGARSRQAVSRRAFDFGSIAR
jgi:hypothetical protein